MQLPLTKKGWKMASLNKRTTAPPPHQNQQSTSQIQLNSAKKEDPLALATRRVPPARRVNKGVLTTPQRKAQQRWDCSGNTNNQAICHGRAWAHNQERFPQSPWCSGSKQSSRPLTAACGRRGWKKQQQQQEKSNQQSTSVFVLKLEITFCSKCTKKEFEWNCCC